jgi:general secretion pathway protein K
VTPAADARARAPAVGAGPCSSPQDGAGGFALLAVIWILALLVILAAGLAADTGGEARLARNRVAQAQARALAEAGVTLGVYSMLDGTLATEWRADGSEHQMDYGGGQLTIALQDEGGKVDLNVAPPELIEGLFGALGVEDAAALTRAIVDRRTAFAAASPAAVPQLPAQRGIAGLAPIPGLGRGPGAGFDMRAMPFAAVEELRLIPGVTQAVYRRIRPFVTVESGNPRIDPQTAPREVLLGLPGVSPQEVGFLLAARGAASAPGSSLPTLSGVDRYVASSTLRAASVRVRAVTKGASFVRDAVVVLTGSPLHPIRFAEWRRGEPEPPPAE